MNQFDVNFILATQSYAVRLRRWVVLALVILIFVGAGVVLGRLF